MPMTICGGGGITSSNPCFDSGPFSRISLTHEAVRRVVFQRSASSQITLNHRSNGIWELSASNTISLTQESSKFRVVAVMAANSMDLSIQTGVSGGHLSLEDVISIPSGTDRFLFDNFGEVVCDNNGNSLLFGE